MALRLDENSITKGSIDNRKKGETIVKMVFVDGFSTQISLNGNPHRDSAGRLVTFYHPNADESLVHEEMIVPTDKGRAGDITAARKVKIPTISLDEVGEYYLAKKKVPYVWKNSLYLEWFTLNGGRCVLEASAFVIEFSESEWEMTDADEKKALEDAAKGMGNFLSMFGNIDASRAKMDDMFEKADEELNEYEWEKLFKHSDQANDRYRELLDKYEDDHDKVEEMMGWNTQNDDEPEFTLSFNNAEGWNGGEAQFELTPEEEAQYEADRKAQGNHPLRKKAKDILTQLESPNKTNTPELGEIWSAVATIGAKLAGAMSGYRSDGTYEDNGFVIAQLKRVLTYLNETHDLMAKENHPLMPELMSLRQDMIDLQTELRKS